MTSRAAALAALVALAPAGCSDSGAARALEAASPFLAEHRSFSAWAERTLESERGHPRSRAELEETLFAPLFLESEVLAAEVRRGDAVYTHGEPVPVELEWQTARRADEELQVAELRVGTTPAIAVATEEGSYRFITVYRRAD